ncbi:MAG: ATP-binding protein [Kiritimatiellae bacterium]|nr:ATP-binding protein [Kiritimatiellia bacterium]
MTIQRNNLLTQIIKAKHNSFIKILTGIRRCGKSYLLFNIFKTHLLEDGVQADHIIEIDLEHPVSADLINPIKLDNYIRSKLVSDGKMNYVLIDEIQYCGKALPEGFDLSKIHPDDRERMFVDFYRVLNGLRTTPNVDVYVTGSNSRLLASDVATEFRGRGYVIQVTPLSFAEFMPLRTSEQNPFKVIEEYLLYGGLPDCVLATSPESKEAYLKDLYTTIYLRDIVERYHLRNDFLLNKVIDIVMSDTATLTNPTKLANTARTAAGINASRNTVVQYLDHIADAFLISKAERFDVKGRRYLDYPVKYYATDTGLRNARINFRQPEFTHLMENAIYNELIRRGYSVDIGIVQRHDYSAGKHTIRQYEIDFVINRGPKQIYIQSAYSIPTAEKREQETFSLRHTGDSFKKVVITNDPFQTRTYDDTGIAYIGLLDFLLDPNSLETL